MSKLSIHGIDPDLAATLKQQAQASGKSVNQLVLDVLKEHAGLQKRKPFTQEYHDVRIVIEVDGKHHYADGEKASTVKYAEMATEDRRLRLAGYDLYRFGGAEFSDVTETNGKYSIGSTAKQVAVSFFQQLFEKYHIKAKS